MLNPSEKQKNSPVSRAEGHHARLLLNTGSTTGDTGTTGSHGTRANSSESPKLYYDLGREKYLLSSRPGRWDAYNEKSTIRFLQLGHLAKSEAEKVVARAQLEHPVDIVGPLAGYKEGYYAFSGIRFLVTSSPALVKPRAGTWDTIHKVLSGLFPVNSSDPRGAQMIVLLCWIKVAYENLTTGKFRPGQALVIAGEPLCGKSLLQQLITEILGGRSANPFAFLSGATNFNADMFGAEHQMIEDESVGSDYRARQRLGAAIKRATANRQHRCEAKHKNAIYLRPFWRLTITLNDEPEDLLVLPPVESSSLQDKMIILKAAKTEMPMPTSNVEEEQGFWQILVGELPAFLFALSTLKIPEALRSPRFGVCHYHHPELLAAMEELSPHVRLLQLIDMGLFASESLQSGQTWEGTAEELEAKLTSDGSACRNEAKKLMSYYNACAKMLGRLAESSMGKERVKRHRTAERRLWRIEPPNHQR